MRPSCGRRFSTISIRASGSIRLTIAVSTLRDLVDLMQHAVDAKADDTGIPSRLNVDVAGTLLKGVLPQPVDDADDVAVIGVGVCATRLRANLNQLFER